MNRDLIIYANITGEQNSLITLNLSPSVLGQMYDDGTAKIIFTRESWADNLSLHIKFSMRDKSPHGEYVLGTSNELPILKELTQYNYLYMQAVYIDTEGNSVVNSNMRLVCFNSSIKPTDYTPPAPIIETQVTRLLDGAIIDVTENEDKTEITFHNSSGTVVKRVSLPEFGGIFGDMQGQKVTNLAVGTELNDAVNKGQLDSAIKAAILDSWEAEY